MYVISRNSILDDYGNGWLVVYLLDVSAIKIMFGYVSVLLHFCQRVDRWVRDRDVYIATGLYFFAHCV